MAQQKHYTIVAAPSKFDLMTALFHGKNGEDHPRVKFTVQEYVSGTKPAGAPMVVEAIINGVSREDGSGESWCIEGYVSVKTEDHGRFKGWYRTTDRKGWMEF